MATTPHLPTALSVAFLTLQVALIAGEISNSVPGEVSLVGEWRAFPGRSFSAPGGSAHLGGRGAVLQRNVTGFVPGNAYRLSFQMKGDVSTSVALVFSSGATAIMTSTVDDGRVKVGYFIAAESSGTLAVSLFGKGKAAEAYPDDVTITPVSPSNSNKLPAEALTRREVISVALGDACPSTAPNPCYNWDGSSKACCPDGCGINTGPMASCTGGCTSEASARTEPRGFIQIL
ncbi:hypothetical protein KFL_001800235 [Klebsormidium nitens]|uniref:Uncharacterized protein n=1 Tax=Klebsormidium nitens TaxID=105231 RepID=A0A1Y1I669_KLENI|nr:hypothetical protein KFL_001800235 [Klebsormidium nitens]|eukprot:GAQ84216.1 hypothetical protein KFL_001800235 [Klebsormidium nitens]